MRLVICGSRGLIDRGPLVDLILAAISAHLAQLHWEVEMVLSGAARGGDRIGELWAARERIPTEFYPAKWNELGRGAGFIRNGEMVSSADAVLALWDGKSPGTADTLRRAKTHCLLTSIIQIPPHWLRQ